MKQDVSKVHDMIICHGVQATEETKYLKMGQKQIVMHLILWSSFD